jgi:hypothetical protein
MERLALVGGILLAIVIALMSAVPNHFNIRIDGDDWGHEARAAYIQPAAGKMAAQAYAGTVVKIIHAAAVVRVIPEARTDVSVEIANPGRAPMPSVEQHDGKVVIDGRLSRRIESCRDDGGVELDGYGVLAKSELPQITIRAPMTMEFGLRGAVRAEFGAAQSLTLHQSGCGGSEVGDMSERLEIHNSGSGTVKAGAAPSAEVHMAGSGDVALGAIAQRLEAHIAGSGEVEAASVRGSLEVHTAGSGDMKAAGGALSNAIVEIAGSGAVEIDAPVETLEVKIAGSGDVTVSQPVRDVDASLAGSGDVTVAAVTGRQSLSSVGSGQIIVRGPPPPAPSGAPSAAAKEAGK